MQHNQIQIQSTQATGARIQLQTQQIQQPQSRLTSQPPTVQIINASPGQLAPAGIITTGTPRVSATQGHVLLPRSGNLPRLVIRPTTINNASGQHISTRAIAPAIQPRPSIFPSGQHGMPIAQQQTVQLVAQVPVNISPQIRPPAGIRMISSAPEQHPVNRQLVNVSGMPNARAASLKHGDLLDKRRIQDLVNEVDPNQQLDEGVQDLLLQIADDFIEKTITTSCQIAKHRNSNSLEVSDVQLFLERNFNMWVPGFSHSDDGNISSSSGSTGVNKLLSESGATPPKKSMGNEAHKQRMALLRKSLKK